MHYNYYINTNKSFLAGVDHDWSELLSQCVQEVENLLLTNPTIYIYGKECVQHRSIGFFSDTSIGYEYSGQIANSQPLTNSLKILLENMNNLMNSNLNGILVNKYSNGEEYIGKHSDDERHISDMGVIMMSYGESRKFRIRDKNDGKIVMDIPTNNNEIIIMGGRFQEEFTHEIPVQKKIKGARYSFTFRSHDM